MGWRVWLTNRRELPQLTVMSYSSSLHLSNVTLFHLFGQKLENTCLLLLFGIKSGWSRYVLRSGIVVSVSCNDLVGSWGGWELMVRPAGSWGSPTEFMLVPESGVTWRSLQKAPFTIEYIWRGKVEFGVVREHC